MKLAKKITTAAALAAALLAGTAQGRRDRSAGPVPPDVHRMNHRRTL